jgi:RimJ/RimL family protein N-acetyltransferase
MDGSRERARATEPLRAGEVTVRPAVATDAEMLCAWHADPEVARFWDYETYSHEQMHAELADPDHDPYIVEEAGEPVGYLQAWFDADDTGIDMFLVPAARGCGIGPRAARLLTGHLLAAGRDEVTVDPYTWNAAGIAAWRKAGFRAVEERAPDEHRTAPWLLMVFDPETPELPVAPPATEAEEPERHEEQRKEEDVASRQDEEDDRDRDSEGE